MSDPLTSLRLVARRFSRLADEADDLLHDALLVALQSGRADLTRAANYRWVVGTLRNLATMSARGAVRRRQREERWSAEQAVTGASPSFASSGSEALCGAALPADLPPSLRLVALLARSGHDRREISWVLRLSDAALRQRIRALRQRLSSSRRTQVFSSAALHGMVELPVGRIRRALLPAVRTLGAPGTHDPDGHAVVLGHGATGRGGAVAHVLRLRGNITRSADSSTFSPEPSS